MAASPNEKLREEIIAIFKDDNWFPTDHPYYIDDLINLFSIHINAMLQEIIDEAPVIPDFNDYCSIHGSTCDCHVKCKKDAIATYTKLIESKKEKI